MKLAHLCDIYSLAVWPWLFRWSACNKLTFLTAYNATCSNRSKRVKLLYAFSNLNSLQVTKIVKCQNNYLFQNCMFCVSKVYKVSSPYSLPLKHFLPIATILLQYNREQGQVHFQHCPSVVSAPLPTRFPFSHSAPFKSQSENIKDGHKSKLQSGRTAMATMCIEANKPGLSPKIRNLAPLQIKLALQKNICKMCCSVVRSAHEKGS